jgi:hypothetical protein
MAKLPNARVEEARPARLCAGPAPDTWVSFAPPLPSGLHDATIGLVCLKCLAQMRILPVQSLSE